MRPAHFNSETLGVKCCRVTLYVANDNRIAHREDLPTSEELTEWVREAIKEGDIGVHELIPPEAIAMRWSEPDCPICPDCDQPLGECACECPTCGETCSARECEEVTP